LTHGKYRQRTRYLYADEQTAAVLFSLADQLEMA